MKTPGETRHLACIGCFNAVELRRQHRQGGQALPGIGIDHNLVDLIAALEQARGCGDIREHLASRQLGAGLHGRQVCLMRRERFNGFRRCEQDARRGQESRPDAFPAADHTLRRAGTERLDPDQREHSVGQLQLALDPGRGVPAIPTQLRPDRPMDAPLRGGQADNGSAAQRSAGLIIAGARFGIDRLHAGPQRGGQTQPYDKRRQLTRLAPPVRHERGEGGSDQDSRPPVRCTRRDSRSAAIREWVAMISPAPASAHSSSMRSST